MAHPIAAAVDGLVALWTGAPSLRYEVDDQETPLKVVDGPMLDDLDEPRGLWVGTATEYLPGGAQAQRSYDYSGSIDTVAVTCELQSWSGDTDPAVVRREALAVLDELTRLLAGDRTLGGTVDWARMVRTTYEPVQAGTGAGALIEFTVRVDAHREHQE